MTTNNTDAPGFSFSDDEEPGFKSLPVNHDGDDTQGHVALEHDESEPGFKSLPVNHDEDDTQGHMGEAFGFSGAIKPDPNVISLSGAVKPDDDVIS